MNIKLAAQRICVVMLLLSNTLSVACADEPLATYVRYDFEGWVFAPATVDEQVVGYLAWLEEEGVGANLRIVWNERVGNGTWDQMAWADGSLHDAVSWIRARYADGMLLAEDPIISAEIAPGVSGGDSVPAYLEHGLNCNDPYQLVIVSSEAPVELITLLQTMGWEVAPTLSQLSALTSGSCYGGDVGNALGGVLNGMTNETELAMFGVSTVSHTACAWPCKCTTTYGESTPTAPGTWTISTITIGSRKKCEYTRPATAPFTRTGKKPIICTSCAATGTAPGREYGAEDVLASESCPLVPSSHRFIPQ